MANEISLINIKMNSSKGSPPQKRKRIEDLNLLNKDELVMMYQNQKKQIEELEVKAAGCK